MRLCKLVGVVLRTIPLDKLNKLLYLELCTTNNEARQDTMAPRTYKATKTRLEARLERNQSSAPQRHPRHGLKVRRGLRTQDATIADRLVEQLNTLLADQSWWSLDRRTEAAQRFDSIVVSAFYDGIEVGKIKSRDLREAIIPLPTPDDGYARVLLVGQTGAGKTTLLRQLIGSDPKYDRFPSTSTAKTTTADIEIVTGNGPFEAAITFMTEHEVRCAVDECLEEACMNVIQGRDESGIARIAGTQGTAWLSYPLGTWQQEQPGQKTVDDQYEMDYVDGDEEAESETLEEDES